MSPSPAFNHEGIEGEGGVAEPVRSRVTGNLLVPTETKLRVCWDHPGSLGSVQWRAGVTTKEHHKTHPHVFSIGYPWLSGPLLARAPSRIYRHGLLSVLVRSMPCECRHLFPQWDGQRSVLPTPPAQSVARLHRLRAQCCTGLLSRHQLQARGFPGHRTSD